MLRAAPGPTLTGESMNTMRARYGCRTILSWSLSGDASLTTITSVPSYCCAKIDSSASAMHVAAL